MRMCVLMSKFFHRFLLQLTHTILLGFAGFLQDMLDLRNCNNGEEFREQEVTGKEQSEGSDIEANLPDTWGIIPGPAAGEIVTVDGSNDDHKPFEPHPDVDDNGH